MMCSSFVYGPPKSTSGCMGSQAELPFVAGKNSGLNVHGASLFIRSEFTSKKWKIGSGELAN